MSENRKGPEAFVFFACNGCAEVDNDPRCTTCRATGQPLVGGELYSTPESCPRIPTRKVIGPCSECAHSAAEEGDEWECTKGFVAKSLVPSGFGCIEWEEGEP